jgi:hypothetical protein
MKFTTSSIYPRTADEWNTLVSSVQSTILSSLSSIVTSGADASRFRVNSLSSTDSCVSLSSCSNSTSIAIVVIVDILPPSSSSDPLAALTLYSIIAAKSTRKSHFLITHSVLLHLHSLVDAMV